MEKFFSIFGKVVLAAIVAGALAGGGVYFGTKVNKQNITQPQPQDQNTAQTPQTVSNNPASPAEPRANTVSVAGRAPFSSFVITVPQGWAQSQTQIADRTKVTVSNGDYQLVVSQAAGGAASCVYPGESGGDFSSPFNQFVAISGPGGQYRRATQQGSSTSGQQTYMVCQKKDSGFSMPSEFGYITYLTPENPSTSTLSALDAMVASIKKQ